MISLKPVIERLARKPEGFAGTWFRYVAGAAEFAQVRPDALPLPACWVIRAAEKSRHAGERAETVTVAFDAVIAVKNVRSHAPGDTDEALLAYRRAVMGLLLGFGPCPDARPAQYDGGRVLQYTDGDLYWADRYVFEALVTNYLPDPPRFRTIQNIGEEP